MKITATVVRVPVTGGHSESVNVRLRKDFDLEDVRRLIKHTPGVKLLDEPENNLYPMPYMAKVKMKFLWDEFDAMIQKIMRSICG